MSLVKFGEDSDLVYQPRPRLKPEEIPETWESVYAFCKWWYEAGTPFMPPQDYEINVTDDATSIALFRKKQFQVELYLIHPKPNLPIHEHPNVEVIKSLPPLYDDKGETRDIPPTSTTLLEGESHGAGTNHKNDENSRGFPLLAFQKWDNNLKVSSVATRWRGEMVGPIQAALVKKHYPDAYFVGNTVDVTRSR